MSSLRCITSCDINAWTAIENESERVQQMRAVLNELVPESNRELLKYVFAVFAKVASLTEKNKMTSTNLAICLGPTLFRTSAQMNDTVAMLIKHYTEVFA